MAHDRGAMRADDRDDRRALGVGRPTGRNVTTKLDCDRRETRPQHPCPRTEAPNPVARRGVRNIDQSSDRSNTTAPSGDRADHLTDRVDHVETPDKQERRDQRMRDTTRPTPSPDKPQTPTAPRDPHRSQIPGPPTHRHPTRRTRRPRHHHCTARGHIRVDRNRTRPYNGHGWIRHPSGPLPVERQLDDPGGVPRETEPLQHRRPANRVAKEPCRKRPERAHTIRPPTGLLRVRSGRNTPRITRVAHPPQGDLQHPKPATTRDP